MEIIIIAAMAKNRVIGKNNSIPWHIPEDLQFFKKTTLGFPVIMGRKTFDSLKKPLPRRTNIVISRNPWAKQDKVIAATSVEEALDWCTSKYPKVFIIGGQQIFSQTIEQADALILSVLDREVAGDCFFPEFSHLPFEKTVTQRYDTAREPFTVHYYRRAR